MKLRSQDKDTVDGDNGVCANPANGNKATEDGGVKKVDDHDEEVKMEPTVGLFTATNIIVGKFSVHVHGCIREGHMFKSSSTPYGLVR